MARGGSAFPRGVLDPNRAVAGDLRVECAEREDVVRLDPIVLGRVVEPMREDAEVH